MTPRTFVVSLVLLATGCGPGVIRIADQDSPATALARLRDSLPRVSAGDSAIYSAMLQWWWTCRSAGFADRFEEEPYLTAGRCGPPVYSAVTINPVVGFASRSDTSSPTFAHPRASSAMYAFAEANRGRAMLGGLDLGAGIEVRLYGIDPTPFDGGIIELSRVGLSTDADTALVEAFADCGPLCGEGVGALLVRTVVGWRVRRIVWLSAS